jgi:UDP-N-acetylglucosamine--N-acetylmuramyl-(pentapeptide) pyrophosphoryl-undecaprenol N-acetylglucosamine transferase
LLQEQNSYAGITNKWLKDRVSKICVAYDGMDRFFPASKIVKTGNPVRGDLVAINENSNKALEFFALEKTGKTLLVLGGSLGSRRINQLIEKELAYFESLDIQLIWQCGKLYYEEYRKYATNKVKVFDFLNRMDLTYAAADFVISRAGAGSVSELCIVGKPVLFIPSPNVAEDHQTKNAQALVAKNAALMLAESQLETEFEMVFGSLVGNQGQQALLAGNIKEMAMPKATEHIVDEIVKMLQ